MKIKLLVSIMIATLLTAYIQVPVFGAEEIPTVKVAMSEDESIIVERIVYTALKRLGYQMVTKTAGMRTTVNDVNYGDAAIVPAQTIGLDEQYPNLIRVPIPISYVESNAYTRSDEPYQFTKWDDLTGLRLSHCWKNVYITKNVPRANASEVVTLNEYEDLWDSLLANETDVAVIPNLTGFVRIVPEGVKLAGVIEREPRYTYVNKDYPELVTLLTTAYQEMTDDGTIDEIRSSSQIGDKQVVLHISSYSSQTEWERSLVGAVRGSLESNPNIEYQNLYLNSAQILNKANTNAIIANTIRTNFAERNPDVIIVSDNEALTFVLNNYYMLFPKVPVVFCGINNFDSSKLHGFEEYFTGVTESVSAHDTIAEMLRLYPQTERIYILNDYSSSSQEWRKDIQGSIDAGSFSVEIEFNENKPFNDILEEIRGFDSETLVLLGTYFSDRDGVFYSEQELQALVSGASKMPVFCLINSFNEYGTLGGAVSVGEEQGNAAGVIARKILGGVPVSEIPIVTESESLNRWQFDYAVANQFNIKTNSLPAGHTAINRELKIWESNPQEFRLLLALAGFLLVIIVGLSMFLRLMRVKNRRLTEMQQHLHSAEELLQKDNDLRRMIDSLPVSVVIADIETCTPEYINQAFLTINGFESYESARQMDLSPLVKRAIKSWEDKSLHFNYGNIREPDSEICQQISIEKLMFNNKNCLLLISEDITAHIKENEMLARAAQKEKEANMFKTKFLANMSHEIRTPMNGIIGMTDLLVNEKLSNRQLQYVKDVKTSAESLLGIINDILDLSKISENMLKIMPVDTDICLLLNNIVSMMSFSAQSKGLDFIDNIQMSSTECVLIDDVRLQQIVVNLLSNAVKFTKAGYVKLAAKIKGNDIVIEISDTGSGIKQEDIPLIFKAFEQVDQQKNRAIKGTGLGLSITKRLVELMGGRLWVESEYGKGSTFHVTLPYIPGDEAAINTPDLEFKYISAPTAQVLLVDDIQTNLTVGAGLLRLCGITTDVAISGFEAIELVKSKDYDIVFMDHMMPEMDGIEAMEHIRKLGEKYAELPIIALTANAVNESKDLLLASGMNDFLSKPIDKAKLMDILKKWLPENIVRVSDRTIKDEAVPYTEVLLKASKIKELDIELALSRISGMQNVLEVSLKQISYSMSDTLKKMDVCLSCEDMHGFAIEAHGLKGALANIGAMHNSELAAELEIAGKAGNVPLCENKFTMFADRMEAFAKELKAIFPRTETVSKPKGDSQLLEQKVIDATDLLQTFETEDAIECLNELNNFTFGQKTDTILEETVSAIESFNYEKAIHLLNTILENEIK